jgi:hypothetical protein
MASLLSVQHLVVASTALAKHDNRSYMIACMQQIFSAE